MALTYEERLVRKPRYQQVNELLRKTLRTGEFAEGEKFLTERQIAERFQISRPTANKALGAMVSEGLLEFRKGVGTFIALPRLNFDPRTLVSFTDKARQAGRTPSTRVLSFKRVKASVALGQAALNLHLEQSDDVFAVTRLRLADGVPVILEMRWLAAATFPGLTRRELRGSFYELCRRTFKLPVSESDQTIRAISLTAKDAETLSAPRGSPAFLVSAVGYARKTPVWWEQTLYRGDSYEFHSPRPSRGRLIQLPSNPGLPRAAKFASIR